MLIVDPPMPAHPLVMPFLEAATRNGRKVVLMTAMGSRVSAHSAMYTPVSGERMAPIHFRNVSRFAWLMG